MMLSASDFIELAESIKFRDYVFWIKYDDHKPYLQVQFFPDNEPGRDHKGRKWFLSEHMTRSEFIRTCFMAVMAIEEHEAREEFLYNGRAVFGPHVDVDTLWLMCVQLDRRE